MNDIVLFNFRHNDHKPDQPEKRRPVWKYGNVPDDGVPFMVVQTSIHSCQYGPDRHKHEKVKTHHDYLCTVENVRCKLL